MSADEPPRGGIVATIAEIDAAPDEATLQAVLGRARAAVAAEWDRRATPTPALAAAWSEAMRTTVATVARLVGRAEAPAWTWFVSGAVGRGEAVPGSRLETLVSLSDDVDDAGKARALVLAADVHAVLERCGLPLDGHGVLASRSRFCRRDVSWEDGIERWAADPAADRGVVMIGLLADAWSVTEAARGERLRPLVIAAARRHAAARTAMLRDAASVRAGIPSRLRILATQDDRVDLEAALIDPIVKIARWGALSAGSHALSTTDRLNHAAAGSVIGTEDASTLCDCYGALSRIRWSRRTAPWLAGGPVDDTVSMSGLAPQERATIRTVAREVGAVRRKLTGSS